jgi:hypothetical protein
VYNKVVALFKSIDINVRKNSELIIIRLLQLLLAFSLFNIVFLQVFGVDDFLFHEMSYPLLYAKNNYDNFSLMSPTFAGRETSPFGYSFVYTLLLFLGLKVNFFTHTIGLLIFDFSILLLIFTFWKFKILSVKSSLLFANLVFIYFASGVSTYSWKDQVWIWPMNSYGVLDFFSIFLSLLIILILRNTSKSVAAFPNYLFYTLCGFFLLFSLNGMRTLLTVVIPSFSSLVFVLLLKHFKDEKSKINSMRIILFSFGSIALGYFTHQFLWGSFPQPNQNSHLNLLLDSPEQFGVNLVNLPAIWLSLFDALPLVPTHVFSFNFLYLMSKLSFAITLICITFVLGKRITGGSSSLIIFALVKLLVIVAIILIPYMFSNNDFFPRYLIPIIYPLFFLIVLLLQKSRNHIYLYIFSLLFVITCHNFISSRPLLNSNVNQTFLFQVNNLLSEKNISKGYFSPYSNGFISLNLISEGKITSAPVDINDNFFSKHYHADLNWYNQNPNSKSFLYLSNWFDEKLNYSQFLSLSQLLDQVRSKNINFQKINYPNGQLYIFDSDIGAFIQ